MRMLLLLLSIIQTAFANTEKTIFLAPGIITIPDHCPSLERICIRQTLSPDYPRLHTQLSVAFPNETHPRGTESWYLLTGLAPSRRYEVRVCWVATQPTDFWLRTYTLSDIFPDLRTPPTSPQTDFVCPTGWPLTSAQAFGEPILFLRIQSAADFFTLNQTLMSNPPPVGVDIILDPYILNIFPQSLLPTGIYIIVIAILSWFLSNTISTWLHDLTPLPSPQKKAT